MPSLNSLLNRVFGSSNDRNLKKYNNRVTEINALESIYENLSDEELKNKTTEFKELLTQGSSLDEILNDAFAAVREASKRTLGQRHLMYKL